MQWISVSMIWLSGKLVNMLSVNKRIQLGFIKNPISKSVRNRFWQEWAGSDYAHKRNKKDYDSKPEFHIERAKRSYRERKKVILEYKKKPCMDCGATYPPYVMTFDHRDPIMKSFEISRAAHVTHERFLVELEKCDLVCANCHAERTWGQGQSFTRKGYRDN
eukprot:GHVR01183293.1.p1 GENE.GHVR01183293.1~~GHVR01183293.1.p1  ORF type:complete len:162 (-),score=0.17 GHVR01183293.1:72-557(-)